MKKKSVAAAFALFFAFIFSGCPPPAASNANEPDDRSPGGVKTNANSLNEDRERLRVESEQLKKDLDELQKKLENANVESNSLQERIRETEREIDETKKKIK
jgi:peptidoglycan hydrolase CwlO-like protein